MGLAKKEIGNPTGKKGTKLVHYREDNIVFIVIFPAMLKVYFMRQRANEFLNLEGKISRLKNSGSVAARIFGSHKRLLRYALTSNAPN
jgi:hypothetical protein